MTCNCGNGCFDGLPSRDAKVLKALRADALSSLPADLWEVLVGEVSKAGGIDEVTGTAGAWIWDAIEKAIPAMPSGDSRSNAGRYAAEQRWKGHTKKTEIRQNLRQRQMAPKDQNPPSAGGEPSMEMVQSLIQALQAVQSGQAQMEQSKVYTILEDLAKYADDAKANGDKAPNLDLCKVSIPNTNLFCGENKGLPRDQMPQLSGIPAKGSKGDMLKKDAKGRINIGDAFVKHLQDMGVRTTDGDIAASRLKASQKELIGADVAGIMKAMESGAMGKEDAIFVSRDGYVIDGHHRWAAKVGLDLKDGKLGDLKMKVRIIDMPIDAVLKEANRFADDMGMPKRSGDPEKDAKTKREGLK